MAGQTWRNSNRTGSRNSANMNALMNEVEGLKRTSFLYQYCQARACRQIEAVIAEVTNREFTYNDALKNTFRTKGVAVMTISHVDQDVRQEHPIHLTTLNRGPKAMSWDDFSNILLELHKTHVGGSSYKSCANFSDRHLGYARDRADDEDLSISNVLRDVPGVRHLDVDTLTLCPECQAPQLLLEMTSEGIATEGVKQTYMSERVADLLGTDFALVQHDVKTVDKLIVTEKVEVRGAYTKSTRVMSREEFKSWIATPRTHVCVGE